MKKITLLLLGLFLHACLLAAPNDTTVIVSHSNTHLSWYENYDTLTSFPNGSTSYRKIIMEFNLGKYACPGYDPNTAGEGPGRSGWCADWDYDVHIIAMTANGDTLELGRLITPYANSNNPSTPSNWNQSYFFDVTDFYQILKNDVHIRIHYAGWSGGFTGTIKFHMIEGTRARNVKGYEKLWDGNFSYGIDTNNINTQITQKTLDLTTHRPAFVEIKSLITGHGGDNQENCAEFCRKYYDVMINDSANERFYIWRDDCGSNFLYPQSGTWIYNRANWCPGNLVNTIIHQIPTNKIQNANSVDIDFNFQNYTYNGNNPQASYKLAAYAFYYDTLNHNIDVALEDIISPSNNYIHNRYNPVCNTGRILIKNYGKAGVISSITFKYGINGNLSETFTWNGTLALNESKEIDLPLGALLNNVSGAQTFNVAIDKVNNANDDDSFNNELSTSFDASPVYGSGTFVIKYTPPGGSALKMVVRDANNNEVFNKSRTRSGNTVFIDTFSLVEGCYSLELSTGGGQGLNFMNMTRGKANLYRINNGDTVKIDMPKSDLGNGAYEGNWGKNVIHTFRISNSLSAREIKQTLEFNIYPNPSQDYFNIEIENFKILENPNVEIYNVVGQRIYKQQLNSANTQINTSGWAKGMYHIVINNNSNNSLVEKIIIQ